MGVFEPCIIQPLYKITIRDGMGLSRTSRRVFLNRSEEHTSELQSQSNLVCRLLLEKKKQQHHHTRHDYDVRIASDANSLAIRFGPTWSPVKTAHTAIGSPLIKHSSSPTTASLATPT